MYILNSGTDILKSWINTTECIRWPPVAGYWNPCMMITSWYFTLTYDDVCGKHAYGEMELSHTAQGYSRFYIGWMSLRRQYESLANNGCQVLDIVDIYQFSCWLLPIIHLVVLNGHRSFSMLNLSPFAHCHFFTFIVHFVYKSIREIHLVLFLRLDLGVMSPTWKFAGSNDVVC